MDNRVGSTAMVSPFAVDNVWILYEEIAEVLRQGEVQEALERIMVLHLWLLKSGSGSLFEAASEDIEGEKLRAVKHSLAFQSLDTDQVSLVSEGKEPECPICGEEFTASDILIKHESCKQTYHHNCLMSWTWDSDQDSCPQCRGRLVIGRDPPILECSAALASDLHLQSVIDALRVKITTNPDPITILKDAHTRFTTILGTMNGHQLRSLQTQLVADNNEPTFPFSISLLQQRVLQGMSEELDTMIQQLESIVLGSPSDALIQAFEFHARGSPRDMLQRFRAKAARVRYILETIRSNTQDDDQHSTHSEDLEW